MTLDVTIVGESEDTPVINYTPDAIDEYMVIVNLPDDWEIVHNYIIDENEIDGIPNRKVECNNDQPFSLRTSIYMMSAAEAEVLKTHPRVETVELNPDKYPQPQSLGTYRYKKNVAFNKPLLTNGQGSESTGYTNGVRSNWSHLFLTNPTSTPYKGVGITTTDTTNSDVMYSLTGKNVDAVTIDTGIGVLHTEFIAGDGTYRVHDVILDGPYKVDPAAFSGYTSSVTIDGVNIGTRADESRARSWWSNTSIRSAAFQSLGTVTISSSYTRIHAHSKNGTGAVTNSHGTSCASQIGGKSFGLAIEANLWNIRINLGEGGIIGGDTSLNICTIWHNAKKVNSGNPDPTILNNSWGSFGSTGNTNGTSYSHVYRGSSLTYTGSGSGGTVPANSGSCRNHKYFTTHTGSGYSTLAYTGDGQYTTTGSTTNTAAENAIAAGVIVVSAAGNTNQKLADKNDIDFDNLYGGYAYVNRTGGVQQGFSGDHERRKGVIRVGALDCAVEPYDSSGGLSKQGVAGYSVRKVVYSANGPMIDVWAPAEFTMSAAYASGEDFQRTDNSTFYDHWFNGTSSACPNTVSLLCLFLESNRSANQDAVRYWLENIGSTEIALSNPYPDYYDEGYWSLSFNSTYDAPSQEWDGYNVRGNGNLRGATNRVLTNPYASNTLREIKSSEGVTETGLTSEYNANNSDSYSEDTYEIAVTNSGTGAYTLTGNDRPDGTPTSSWAILMHTTGHKGQTGGQANTTEFGNTGSSTWRSITASSTGANNRDAFGDGAGLYDAFFTASGITKIALVDGTGNMSDMTSHNNYLIYDLVGSGTGSETIWDILYRLDQYNANNASWSNNDTLFGTDSCTDFTAGTAKSGTLSAQGGSWEANNANPNGSKQLSEFHIWGVNRDSDNDTQVLCSCAANLATGKADSWRYDNPDETFWSYWGNDWHSNTQSQTIGSAFQTNPGVVTGETAVGVYLMALTSSGGVDGAVSGNNPTLKCRVGDTMKFNVNASGHPFWIKTSNSTGTGNAAAGVTNNGSDSGTVTWDTSIMNAGTYHYNCQNHSAMHGTITLSDNLWKDLWAGHNGTIFSFGGSGRRPIWDSSNGGIIDFDGSTSSAVVTANASDFDFGSGEFAVEVWCRPTNASQVDPGVVALWNYPDGRRSWGIFGDTGGSAAAFNGSIRGAVSPDGAFATRTEITGTLTLNAWNHVVFTRIGNTLTFYINNSSAGTASYTGSVYTNSSDGAMIGALGDASACVNQFNGKIGEVRIYKGSGLTAAEVEHNYNTTKARYTDLADVTVQGSFGESKLTYVGDSNTIVAGLELHTHTNDVVLGTEPPPPPTYSISQTATSVNEGGNIVYTVTTTNVTDGTTLYWSLAGTAVAADFNPASLTGAFTISGNSGTFNVTVATDTGSDGGETFTASVRTGSTSGTVVATANQVTITDVPPVPTYSVSQDTTTVTEGNSVVYTLSTTYVSNGTTLYWSLAGTAVAADFNPASLTGSFSVSSNSGTFTVTTATDAASDGGETFTASIRTGSTSGTVVATANQVTITDVAPPPTGQEEWITAGTYTWTCPANVTSVCVLCIGAGGTGGAYGGSGGSLAYKNNISVTPGNTYTIVVGATNSQNYGSPYNFPAQDSSALNCVATGGQGGYSGSSSSTRKSIGSGYDGGGRGGLASGDFYEQAYGYKGGAGGGAGGYGGDGGDAGKGVANGTSGSPAATAGSAGGGGGGAPGNSTNNEGGGGGTGIYGQGTSGAAAGGNNDPFGKGGSGGGDGTDPYGGQYGGGSGAIGSGTPSSTAQNGAVRIIWGSGRAYPSTNTADVLTPWFDLDNMSFTGKAPNYRWRAQTTDNTNGVYLKPDGTILYILSADRKIRRHNLSTAYDLGTASYHSVSSAVTVQNGVTIKGGLFFKSDGTKLFYNDNDIIRAYTLSTAWDIQSMSLASDSLSLTSMNNSANGSSISFKPDGSKIYVSEGPNGNSDIHQWSLSTSWDLSTASYGNVSPSFTGSQQNNILGFSWKADGTEIIVTHGSYYIGRWPISTAWDITTRGSQTSVNAFYQVVEGMDGLGMNIQWKSDGTVAFVPYKLQTMAQLEPSSAWTLSSVSNDTPGDQSEYVKWITCRAGGGTYCTNWSSDGLHFYVVGGSTTMYKMSASTAFDIKTVSNSYTYGTLYGTGYGTYDFKFNSNGTVLLVINTHSNKKAFQYSLSTGFDLSTISSSYTDLDLTSGSGSTQFQGGCISDDGKYIYMNQSMTIYQWTMSTPFNLSTASFTRSQFGFNTGGWDSMCKISPDGKHIITHNNEYSSGKNRFSSYELTTAWDISTKVSKKDVYLHDKAPHAPILVHSAGWTIANGSWYFNLYYDYAGFQIDF